MGCSSNCKWCESDDMGHVHLNINTEGVLTSCLADRDTLTGRREKERKNAIKNVRGERARARERRNKRKTMR